jgi:hypothetical protein
MYTTHLNSKEIDLFLEICYNKKTNRLNEDIFKKLKQGSSRIAKSLTKKFYEIKRAFKNPKLFGWFLNWLKAHRSKIRNLTLITTALTTFIACDVGKNKWELEQDKWESEQVYIEDAYAKYRADHPGTQPHPGPGDIDVFLYETEIGEDGVPRPKGLKIVPPETLALYAGSDGHLGFEESPTSLRNSLGSSWRPNIRDEWELKQKNNQLTPDYSLSRVSSQFGNVLDNIQGIFFYNKVVENSLVDLTEKIKADFEKNSVKSKQYTETIRMQNEEYKAFYMVYNTWNVKDDNPDGLQNFINNWKSSVLQQNPTDEDIEIIDKVADEIYKCARDHAHTGSKTGGFVCNSAHEELIKTLGHILPAVIVFNQHKTSSFNIDDVIRHETGHMLFDNDYITSVINYIIANHADVTVTKEKLQSIILESMSLSINKKPIDSSMIKIKDLPESITARIKNTIKNIAGLMLASGEIQIKKNGNVKINLQNSEYMSRHNEFIQHMNDKVRGFVRLLKQLKIKSEPKSLALLMKIIADSEKGVEGGSQLNNLYEKIEDFIIDLDYFKKIKKMSVEQAKTSTLSLEEIREVYTKLAREELKKTWQEILSEYNKVYKTPLNDELQNILRNSIVEFENKENLELFRKWIISLGQLSVGHISSDKDRAKSEVKGFALLIYELVNYLNLNRSDNLAGEAKLDDLNADLGITLGTLSILENTHTTGKTNESVRSFHKIKEAVFYRLLNESYV